MMVRLTSIVTAVAVASLGMAALGVPASAQAAASVNNSRYALSYGHGDYYAKGNIRWLNRTIIVGGKVNAVEYNCAKVEVVARHGSLSKVASRIKCSGEKGYSFKLQLDVPGGVSSAAVTLYVSHEGHHRWNQVANAICTRSVSTCS